MVVLKLGDAATSMKFAAARDGTEKGCSFRCLCCYSRRSGYAGCFGYPGRFHDVIAVEAVLAFVI